MTFWLDWLDRREPVVHTDAVIEHIEVFHDSVAAALEWSTERPSRRTPALAAPGPRLAWMWSSASGADRGRPAADRRERRAISLAVGRRLSVGGRPRRHRSKLARGGPAWRCAGGLSPTKRATSTSSPSTTSCSDTRRTTPSACAGSRMSGGSGTSSASPPWPRLPSRSKQNPQRGVGDARRRGLSGRRS